MTEEETVRPVAPREDEELAIAMLAACEATIRHLWDIAARFDTKQCNLIRDEIHRLNTITLPAIQDLRAAAPVPCAAAPADPWQPIATAPKDGRQIVATDGVHYWISQWVEREASHLFPTGIHQFAEMDGAKPTYWMPLNPPRATGEGARDGAEGLRTVRVLDSAAAEESAADAQRLLAEISERLAKRRAPQVGTCSMCGHQQEMMPTYQTIASSMAMKQWECQSCGAPLVFTFTIGSNAPTQDDDIAALLELCASEPR